MKKALLPCTLFLFVLTVSSWGQKNTDKIRAAALKADFADARIAAERLQSDFHFSLEKNSLIVKATEEIEMISLEGNIPYSREVFYNDNVSVASTGLQYIAGKSIPAQKTCGNYEVDGIFYSDAKVCSFKMHFLHEGTGIAFRSTVVYEDPRYLTKIFFHDELPVKSRVISFFVPSDADVELVEKNFNGFNIEKSVERKQGGTIHTYRLEKVKALVNEANSLGVLHYYPHLVVITKEYAAGSGKKTVIGSVSDLYQWYSSMVKGVKNDPASFREEVDRLTATAKTPEDKIKAIYYWVQDNIKYVAFEDGIAGFRPEAAQTVYHNRYGDCKGMANLTKEMLNTLGFDARLAWIGTNRIPYTYELPSLAVDNHMICTVNAGEKQYILDPTEKFIALGRHGERIQGKEMMIQDGDRFIVKKVPVADPDQNLILRKEEVMLDGETLKGSGEIAVHGEAMKNILYLSTNVKQEEKKKVLDYLAVSDYTNKDKVVVTNDPPVDRDKALEVKYTFGLSHKVSRFENDVYIDLDWTKNFKDSEIDADRLSDYYFQRKVKNKVIKKFTVPPGYKVSHLPASLEKKHPDFSIAVKYERKGNIVYYTNEIVVTHGIIRKPHFETWNTFIRELNEVYNDQVVLTKAK